MRGKQGFRQTRNRDARIVFAAADGDTLNIDINTATPNGLNGTDPVTIFSGFQATTLPQNSVTSASPVARLAQANNRFVLLPYVADLPGNTPTASQILVSTDAKKWRTKTLPTRTTADPIKHAWAEVHGSNGRFIVSHSHYPDIAISENGRNWTLLQDVFAINSFQQNGIVYAGNNTLIAAADDSKTIYRSDDNGLTWAQIAANILITENTAAVKTKTLDQIISLTYGGDSGTNVFFMLAKRNDVSRYRYVLTSVDGINWTQRLRVDLGTVGTPQEPIIASSPARTILVLNNLVTATTIVTTTSASNWLQLLSTPAANWRAAAYDGEKFVVTGEPRSTTADPVVMTLNPITLIWSVKLTSTKKIRDFAFGPTVQPQEDGSVSLLLNMAGTLDSTTFTDISPLPKTVTATNMSLTDAQFKWPSRFSTFFSGANSGQYLSITGHPDIAVGTNDFTIEAWVWMDAYASGGPLWESNPINTWGNRPNGFVWYFGSDGTLRVFRSGGDILNTAANIVPLQTWVHVALVRKNNRTAIYVNGQIKASTFTTFNDTAATSGALIGRFCDNGSYGFQGYIGEFRIVKGVALYEDNTFNVPTAPFLNYTPLGAPTGINTFSDNKKITISWQAPWQPNSVTVTDYVIDYSLDDGVTWITAQTVAAVNTAVVLNNLTNGVVYKFRVAAMTEDGIGPFSSATETVVVGGDQYFDNVALLLHMDGTDGSTTFTDSSGFSRPLTRFGDPRVSTTQNRFGGASAYFNGSSYVSAPASADFDFSAGDFTIEGWVYNTHSGHSGIIGSRNNGTANGWCLYIYNNILRTGSVRGSAGYSDVQLHPTPIAQNTWTHFAVVKTTAGYTAFINGAAGPVLTGGGFQYLSGLPVSVGALASYGELPFLGYIDDIRVTKSIARYTQPTFTVPAFPFIDDGPLSAPANFKASGQDQSVKLTWQAPRARGFLSILDYSVQYSEDAGVTWNTFADGVSTATTTTVTGLVNNTNYLFRVAAINDDGTGPYATTATPVTPTNGDPLFNSVSLLLRFNETTGTFIDTSPRPKTLTANNGGATFNALSKWGDGSAFFQGGSLTTPSNTDFSFGIGDFTIEFWAYPTADTWAGAMINVGYYYDGILFRQRNGVDSLYLNSSWVNWNSQTNMPSNVWTHVALVREAGVVAVYANGTRILTWNNTANLNSSGTFVTIGVGSHSGFGEPFYGYLDELRITKGFARYSGVTADVPTAQYLGAPT